MSIINHIKRNKLLLIVGAIYLALVVFKTDKAILSFKNSSYYIIEMLQIMPVIFILTSLIEAWVPRKVIMNSFGESSGKKGAIISFLLGSISAGPIYAAFPVCKMLLKKGARISNIVIILSTWAVIKVPMLANEAKFLGPKFMAVRWVLTTISIFIMAYLVSKIVSMDTIPVKERNEHNNDTLRFLNKAKRGELYMKGHVDKDTCIGCGLCPAVCPEIFEMDDDGKAIAKGIEIPDNVVGSAKEAEEQCPVDAIKVQ